MDKPVIDYPCEWGYRLIGRDEEALRLAVTFVLEIEYELKIGNRSENDRYCSLHLKVKVHSEEERLGLFDKLKNRPEVIYVL